MSQITSEHFREFDPSSIPAGSKLSHYYHIATLANGDPLRLAVLVAKGAKPGKTLVALGGVHGDEYEAPHAIREAFKHIDPSQMQGDFIGVPQCNVPAFLAGTRTSPIDGLNLARVFPGKVDGTVTERIAYYLGKHVISHADLLVDLHSSGTKMNMASLIGYHEGESVLAKQSREAAFAFGMPVLWGHPNVSKGRTLSFAYENRIPGLYTESPGGNWLHLDESTRYTRGVLNLMRHLNIIDGEIEKENPTHHLIGDGNVDIVPTTSAGGYFIPKVKVLDRVNKGDLIGRVVGLAGETHDMIYSDSDGVVIMIRATPSVVPGDTVFLVTKEYQG